MTRRADIAARLPVLAGLKLAEAAAFVGVSAGLFLKAQAKGKMPLPRDFMGTSIYDADELWAAFKALDHVGDLPCLQEESKPSKEIML